ncbi:hypothetical protein ABB02_01051 [Clostridiaceae bacterium JG1575]|nr:hypothetical protein ABB02_01051 [Clostridiaceae bacterium JG1575]
MKKLKSIPLFLVMALVLSLIPGPLATAAPQKSTPAALTSLLSQTAGRYAPNDRFVVVVKANETAIRAKKPIQEVSLAGLSYEDDLSPRVAYTKKVGETLLSSIRSHGIQGNVLCEYNVFFSGFALEVTLDQAKALAQDPNVASVMVSRTYHAPVDMTPLMNTSKPIVHAKEAWDLGYTGRGQLIAVLDSGIDTAHQDFSHYDAATNGKHKTPEAVRALIQEHQLPGRYETPKVPYGFNYYDVNHEIKDTNKDTGMHGQHVAGTIAANGTEANGGVRGIAPDAQLLALRVFGQRIATTGSYVYSRAMEHALLLKADTMNLSLGAPAGETGDEDPLFKEVVKKCREAGVMVNIAAGNEGQMAEGAANPKSVAPDYGVVGTPSVEQTVLSVASIENTHRMASVIEVEDHADQKISYAPAPNGAPMPDDAFYAIVDCKLGKPEEVASLDLKDKIALVKRGDLSFADKAKNVKARGAKAMLAYNHEEGGEVLVNMGGVDAVGIPAGFAGNSAGRAILAGNWKLKFPKNPQSIDNVSKGRMSAFSSYGPTTKLSFKPEITAPGGNIYSTLNDNQYGNMSGTSMATPHLSGGSALIKARVEKDFESLSASDRYDLVKQLLMSTARPHVDPDKNAYTSPRKQGAGVMNLQAAATSNAVLLGDEDKESKITLGQFSVSDPTVSFSVKNLGDKELKFSAKLVVTTDEVENQRMTLKPFVIEERDLEEIAVSGKATEKVSFKLDLSKKHEELMQKMPNGYFADGFIVLTEKDGSCPELSIPFMGFYGDWDNVPAVDTPLYQMAESETPLYGGLPHVTGFLSTLGIGANQKTVALGLAANSTPEAPVYDATKVVFSPNGDQMLDTATLRAVFTRNYSGGSLKIRKQADDPTGTPVFQTFLTTGVKNHYSGNERRPKSREIATWKGTDASGTTLADGRYVATLEVTPETKTPKVQSFQIPLLLDTTAPEIVNAKQEASIVTLNVTDALSGVKELYLMEEGSSTPIPVQDQKVDISGKDINRLSVHAMDFGYNRSNKALKEILSDEPVHGTLVRIEGKDRYETAAKITKAYYKESKEAILVSGSHAADILTVSPLAELKKAPLLITESKRLTPSTLEELKRLKVEKVTLVGGPVALSEAVEKSLQEEKISVERLNGETRYDTALAVAKAVSALPGADLKNLIVVSGHCICDGLSVAQLAAKDKTPVLLTQTDALPEALKAYLKDKKFDQITLIGGEKALSKPLEKELGAHANKLERLGGATRYETALAVARHTYPKATSAFITTGIRSTDALVIGPVSAQAKMPILLTEAQTLPVPVGEWIKAQRMNALTLLGGPVAIDPTVEEALKALLP